jgi:hypothetical protein
MVCSKILNIEIKYNIKSKLNILIAMYLQLMVDLKMWWLIIFESLLVLLSVESPLVKPVIPNPGSMEYMCPADVFNVARYNFIKIKQNSKIIIKYDFFKM